MTTEPAATVPVVPGTTIPVHDPNKPQFKLRNGDTVTSLVDDGCNVSPGLKGVVVNTADWSGFSRISWVNDTQSRHRAHEFVADRDTERLAELEMLPGEPEELEEAA